MPGANSITALERRMVILESAFLTGQGPTGEAPQWAIQLKETIMSLQEEIQKLKESVEPIKTRLDSATTFIQGVPTLVEAAVRDALESFDNINESELEDAVREAREAIEAEVGEVDAAINANTTPTGAAANASMTELPGGTRVDENGMIHSESPPDNPNALAHEGTVTTEPEADINRPETQPEPEVNSGEGTPVETSPDPEAEAEGNSTPPALNP
jgi:hypothetical protein